MALSRKWKDGKVLFVDSFVFDVPKTAVAKKVLVTLAKASGAEQLATKKQNAALIALSDGNVAANKSFRNIGSISLLPLRDLNSVAVLGSSYLILENPEAGIAILQNRASKKNSPKNLTPNT